MWFFQSHALHLGDDFALGSCQVKTVAGKFPTYHPPTDPGWRYPHLSPQQVWYHIRRRIKKRQQSSLIKPPNKWRSRVPLPSQEEAFKVHKKELRKPAKKTTRKQSKKRHTSALQRKRRTAYNDLNAFRAKELITLKDPVVSQFYKRGDRTYIPRRLAQYRQTCHSCMSPMVIDYRQIKCPYEHQNYDQDESCAPTCHVFLTKCNTCRVGVIQQVRRTSAFIDGANDYEEKTASLGDTSYNSDRTLLLSKRTYKRRNPGVSVHRKTSRAVSEEDDWERRELLGPAKRGSRPCHK